MAQSHISTYFLIQPNAQSGGIPICELSTSATDFVRVTRIFINWTTTPQTYGIGKPAVSGIPKVTGPVLAAYDGGNSGYLPNVTLSTDWLQRPTAPAQFFRRVSSFPNMTSDIYTLSFNRGLGLAPSSSLVMWLITGNNQLTIHGLVGFEVDG